MMCEDPNVNRASVDAIAQSVARYRANKVGLFQLVNELEGGLNGMYLVPREWRSQFIGAWGVLEEVNALELDARTEELSAEDKAAVILEALKSIDQLVVQAKLNFAA